jgi:hypothetical protein
MFEQTIRLVTSETNVDGITLRFGPLGNKSHQKQLLKEIQLDAQRIWDNSMDELNKPKMHHNEASELAYNKVYPTLRDMNFDDWKLESFALIYDANQDRMQVAIFSREIK